MSREGIAAAAGALGIVGIAACFTVGAASSIASSPAACRAGHLQFGKPLAQGINSISIGYGIRIENVGARACTIQRFLIVRVPKNAPAAVDVIPYATSDLAPRVDLRRPLVLEPRHAAGTYLVLTTPCGGVDAFVGIRLQLAIEVPYGQAEQFFSMPLPARGCRSRPNQIELWPLTAA